MMKRGSHRIGDVEIYVGSGNIWEDLGFPDAEEMLAKSELVLLIQRTIRTRQLTQAQAAQLMGIDQPKVSKLLHGSFRGFSTHRLLEFLAALGRDVEIVIGRPKRAPRRGRIRVVAQ
jgi:predicted XRE-type DNA-binding protein